MVNVDMSGWTTLTLELRGEDDYHEATDGGHVTDDVLDAINGEMARASGRLLKAGDHAEDGDPVSFVVARFPGTRSNANLQRDLARLEAYATRAVGIRANDTSDTGDAVLFERVDGEWTVTDEFEENQTDHGVKKGERAAAEMHVRHGIPAVSLFERFY